MTPPAPAVPDRPWGVDAPAVADALRVAPDRGLTSEEARRRIDRFGPNVLREHPRRSAWSILVDQFRGLVIGLLVVAAIAAALWGEWLEAGAIGIVLLINAAIGFFTELRAVRSMEALRELGQVTTRVRRDGEEREVPADELVPGDIVLVEGGDVVTADLRLLEASKLQANESTLTGESVAVGKAVEPVGPETILAERESMLFKGTAVTRGAGTAIVVGTGMDTELGRIASLVEEAEEEESTPLERRLEGLGRRLVLLTLGVAAAVTVSGILGGRDLLLMIETGIALAVAAVPEGLPVVATIALARGMRLMARRNALINRLSSVETLGTTDVIFTDKTGTLTQNRMTVVRFLLPSGVVDVGGSASPTEGEFREDGTPIDPQERPPLREALKIGLLCNNASLTGDSLDDASGDPTEIALLVAGAKAGLSRGELREASPEEREEAFDPDVKMMATFHATEGEEGFRVAVKGAPDAVLPACTAARAEDGSARTLDEEERERWLGENERLASDGLRVLALAAKRAASLDEEPYRDLVFVGIVAMQDPPREEVREALEACRTAGVEVVMVTGDQPATARGIALAVGLVSAEEGEPVVVPGSELEGRAIAEEVEAEKREAADANAVDRLDRARIFARVSPRHKLELIARYRGKGHVVAMTGDGVNDAPALKKADIGIAMGARGTQVAKEAADMILEDDAFGTIVAAIEQGRIIFDNIRRFALYLLSCNTSEVMVVGAATLVGAPLPVLPLQLLFLNFVTDVFPALALGFGQGEEGVMRRPPRAPGEAILVRRHWIRIALGGAMITVAVLAALGLALRWLGFGTERAVTVSFLTLAVAQLWHVFNMRSPHSGVLRNEVTRNRLVWGALALCGALLLAAVYLPGVSDVLQVSDPGRDGWALAVGLGFVPLLLGQAVAIARRRAG